MKYLIYTLGISSIVMIKETSSIFDFNTDSDLSNWMVLDDVVMGGRSDGNFVINEQGNATYSGTVSLENNGGFSSIRYHFDEKDVKDYNTVKIRLKGDGKRYQFRVKSTRNQRYSYITYFETSGEWETIEVKMADMYPRFRGRKLDLPNYPKEKMEEIAFLISNKKAEYFELELDWIQLSV